MSDKQFVVLKGEYWWAVVNTQRVEDRFECRNKEVALRLCDFLNRASDDLQWQINRCEKLSAKVKQLKEEIEPLKQKEEVLNKIWRDYLENHE